MRPFVVSDDDLVRRLTRLDATLLEDVLRTLDEVEIREALIRHRQRLVFGQHNLTNGTITLGTPLARVATYLHEATHHVRPDWPEEQVQQTGSSLLRGLTYRDIATINRRLLAKIAASA